MHQKIAIDSFKNPWNGLNNHLVLAIIQNTICWIINANFGSTGYCPGPDSDLSMNFLLAKQSHHLLGLPSSVANTCNTKYNFIRMSYFFNTQSASPFISEDQLNSEKFIACCNNKAAQASYMVWHPANNTK